jgi:UDP-N-acetylglucosamine 2-epimerase (non-hydrolysing)
MKVAPVHAALHARGAAQTLIHTGQHYDRSMSDVFFDELGLPHPDVNLNVGSGRHGAQTGEVMIRIEPVLAGAKPDWLLVYGDVNSTMAAALVAAKLGIRLAHVEAGLRSGDRSMPEEINRLVTDRVADLLLTPSADADENLEREGIPRSQIRIVGNVMIDTLQRLLPESRRRWAAALQSWCPPRFLLVTLHRPSNVDEEQKLGALMQTVSKIAEDVPVIFPVHPRTREAITRWRIHVGQGVRLIDPLGYLDFLALEERAAVVVTDSGGVQEETTYLGVPCFTLRSNTERPITVSVGTNTLVGADLGFLQSSVMEALAGHAKVGRVPPLWDGRAAERIAGILNEG